MLSVCSLPAADALFKYGHWHAGHSFFLANCGYIKLTQTPIHSYTRTKLSSSGLQCVRHCKSVSNEDDCHRHLNPQHTLITGDARPDWFVTQPDMTQ